MGGVRGVKSGGPPPRNRRVDLPPFPPIIGESFDSVPGCAIPDILNPLLEPFDLKPKIMATGPKLADESAGQDHLWYIYFGGEGFDQIFSIVCGFPDKLHSGLDRVVPATYFGIRVLQEALHQCELSLKIFGSLLDAVQEESLVDDGIADFLYDIVYARDSHGFSLVREEDLTNSSWG